MFNAKLCTKQTSNFCIHTVMCKLLHTLLTFTLKQIKENVSALLFYDLSKLMMKLLVISEKEIKKD